MRTNLSRIKQNHKNLIKHYSNTYTPVPQHDIKNLLILALTLSVISLLSYFIGGYHVAFASINDLTPNIPEFLLHNITVLGDGAILLPLALLFFTRNIQFQWTLIIAAIVLAILSNLLKNYFGFTRPAGVLEIDAFNLVGKAYSSRSFPSGHTMTAFTMASVCYCYVKNNGVKAFLIIAASLTGLSRILVGAHWPMDVLVGAPLGIIIGVTSVYTSIKWKAGLRSSVHLFTLALLSVSCLIIFIEGNDYTLAIPLMIIVSTLALVKTLNSYIFIGRTTKND